MDSRSILVAGIVCFSIHIIAAHGSGNDLRIRDNVFYSVVSNASEENQIASLETVHLLRCPGSAIKDGLLNISEEFLRKYGLQVGEDDIFNSLKARFTEGSPECPPSSVFTSVKSSSVNNDTDSNGHAMQSHGWILKYYSANYWESIPPNRYCIVRLDEDNEFEIKYCRSDCMTEPCVSKCCFANEVCDLGKSYEYCECTDSGLRKWTTTIEQSSESSYSFVHHLFQSCESTHFTLHENSVNLNYSYQNDFKILKNGSVQFHRISDGTWITLAEGTYCVDGVAESNPNSGEAADFSGETSDMVLTLCRGKEDLVPEEVEPHKQQFILYTILVPFATVFVLLTITVYILTWQEQNIYGYTNFFYLVTLLTLYVFIVMGNVHSIVHPEKHPIFCAFIAGVIHFSYLSSACWVTCISYDVWRTFKNITCVTSQSKGKRRFVSFCAFSLGYPLLQVVTCAILDTAYRNTPAKDVSFILPNYGHFSCNMSNDGVTYYLFVPISVLLACNIIFFIATITAMVNYKKSIREAFAEISLSANPSKANQSFGIYTRLFIIMGIFWISQIISWFVLLNEKSEDQSLEMLFAVTDALTVLQAVAIFYIFVCKRSVFANLWTLHPWLRPFLSLWVKYGCCPPPPSVVRIGPAVNSTLALARKRSSNDTSGGVNRVSRDSGILQTCSDEQTVRQVSLSSAGSSVTIISELEDVGKVVNVSERETANGLKVSETKL